MCFGDIELRGFARHYELDVIGEDHHYLFVRYILSLTKIALLNW